MRNWLQPYSVENYKRKVRSQISIPAVGRRGQSISRDEDSLLPELITPVDEYICGLFSIRKQVTQRFDNLLVDTQTSDQLKRLLLITKSGRVWVDEDDRVLALEIRDILNVAKRRFTNQESKEKSRSIISTIFSDTRQWDVKPPLFDFQVIRDAVPKVSMTPDALSLCEFFESTTVSHVGRSEIGLSVSGWSLEKMEQPNPFICMLAERYDEVILLVEPKSRMVRFVRAVRY
ncbi:hypothetical protein [Alicyclobacillus cycloheptanicus]|uniref:Uncharacterized protein n=1 Tax=Alicyclobacillus cycloheptanicus TaxID=1457 RepID=A0ABT9XMY0_9BACL|nr:hypothetical protein [Alicyclobacillus cycloheptanicus]MDQ0191662.1 hypothetical protein [Alicyclobacillus cycloheptanicus]